MKVTCPKCKALLAVREGTVAKNLRCGKCGTVFDAAIPEAPCAALPAVQVNVVGENTVVASGGTLDEVRRAALWRLSIKAGDVIEERVVNTGEEFSLTSIGGDAAAARQAAQNQMGPNGYILREELTQSPGRRHEKIAARGEAQARQTCLKRFRGAKVESVQTVTPGKSGFLGIGGKNGEYVVEVVVPAELDCRCRRPAEVSLHVRHDAQFARLLEGFKADKWADRKATAKKLAGTGGYTALWGHARLLGDDESTPAEVDQARRALEGAGSLAVAALRAALDDHVQVSTAGAKLLAKIGTPEAIGAIAEAIGEERGSGTFQKENGEICAAQLFEIGVPAVPALLNVLRQGKPKARERAAETLGRLAKEKKVPETETRAEMARGLAALLEDSEHGARREAARALGQLGADAAFAVEPLCFLLDDPRDKYGGVRSSAADALKGIGPAGGPRLIKTLDDPKRRQAALEVLEALDYRGPDVFEHVKTCWAEKELRTAKVLRYLARLSPDGCAPLLAEALKGEPALATEAGRILAELKATCPHIADALGPAVADAAKHAFEEMRDLIRQGKQVNEQQAFCLPMFGEPARQYAEALCQEIAKAGASAAGNPWLTGALACIAPDPKPYFVKLLQPMREADEGRRPAPMMRIGGGGVTQVGDVRQVFGGMLGDALAFVSAWGANSPAMNSQTSLKRAIAIMGERGREELSALKGQFPKQVETVVADAGK